MEPLSDVLALLKPQTYVSAGLSAAGAWAVQFPVHQYIKFNAVTKGSCWITVQGGGEPQKLEQGDCFLLPSGRPFVLASDLSLPKIPAETVYTEGCDRTGICNGGGEFSLVGARFQFSGEQADALFASLPAVVAARESSDQASVLRWSLDRFERDSGTRAGSFTNCRALGSHHVDSGPALARRVGTERRNRMACCFGRPSPLRSDSRHARRYLTSVEFRGAWEGGRHVPIKLCKPVQADCTDQSYGVPDALENACRSRPTKDNFPHDFEDRQLGWLRVRCCLQHGFQESHWAVSAKIPTCSQSTEWVTDYSRLPNAALLALANEGL